MLALLANILSRRDEVMAVPQRELLPNEALE